MKRALSHPYSSVVSRVVPLGSAQMMPSTVHHSVCRQKRPMCYHIHTAVNLNSLEHPAKGGKSSVLRWQPSHQRRNQTTTSAVDKDSFRMSQEDFDSDNNRDDSESRYYHPLSGPNPGLASIISQGIKSLEKSAADIEYRTRNASLSQPHKRGSFQAGTLEPRQMAEGQRILDVASECLEQLILQAERGAMSVEQRKGLFLSGEPIVLLECVVNRNAKQAKLYWTLPYGILLDERMHAGLYRQITVKVQEQLLEGGGAKLLSKHVHARLSSYYAPRIKMLPATDEMVAKALEESLL